MGKFAELAERIGKTFEQGQVAFRQGDTGDFMYFIYHGAVEVTREQGGERIVLGRLESGEFFGEMALVDAKPRSATVTAVARTRVIPISQDFLRQNIRRDVGFIFQLLEALSRRLEQTNDLLRRRFTEGKPPAIPPLGSEAAEPKAISFLKLFRGFADPGKYRNLRTDEAAFRQGDLGEVMYIILEGKVMISLEEKGETIILAELGRGDFFGEAALIAGGVRTATATAITPAILLPVDREALVKGLTEDAEAALHVVQILILRLRRNIQILT